MSINHWKLKDNKWPFLKIKENYWIWYKYKITKSKFKDDNQSTDNLLIIGLIIILVELDDFLDQTESPLPNEENTDGFAIGLKKSTLCLFLRVVKK